MGYFRTFIFFMIFTTGYCVRVQGQLYFPEDMVKVSGQVVDASSGENIGYAQVVNFRIHGGTMCDAAGKFSIQADPSDTLTFKLLGYKDKSVAVKDILSKGTENVKIAMTLIRFQIDQVEVNANALKMNLNGIPQGKTSSVPSELRSDDFNSKPGVLTALLQPISFLHYELSNAEKEKRTTLAAIHSERQWQILSLVYNKDVIQRITLLTGDKLDDFMAYCNAYIQLTANATTYDVEKKVKDLYVEYKKLHPY
jgi:hypothetical protein